MSVLLHVPHASTLIPPHVRQDILLDDFALHKELLEATDHHTDGIVGGLEHGQAVRSLINPYSRLVVDPERFLDPTKERTETVGRGVVATKTVHQKPLRDVTQPQFAARRQELIDIYFAPYHAQMDAHVAHMLARNSTVTIIDVHSFPQFAQPYELDADGERPELCIGTDPIHTPLWLRELVVTAATQFGLTTTFDTPFAGTFVPQDHYGDGRVASVMFEFRRDTFSNEETGQPHAGIARCRAFVQLVIAHIRHGA